jgi:hypothetical protein
VTAFGTACLFTGCAASTQRTTTVESGGDVASSSSAVTPANNRTIPIGARLVTRLDQTLGTSSSKVGDVFTATVEHTLRASDGSVVVPAGAQIEGRVTARDDSDHAGDPALLRLAFDRIRWNGQSYPFSASIVQSNAVETREPSGSKTKQIIIGGAVGAALGSIIGGDVKDIIIGGAIGAAAGSIVSLGTEVNASLPAGSQMTVQATQTTTIR